jgi:iron complex transport system substrate-binding protein
MSLNLCTDQLLLQLVPAERITSVTYLSRSAAHSYLSAEAFGVPVNYGTSEEVLAQHPDLVLAGDGSTPAVRALLKKVGMPLVEVPSAENFDEIRAVIRLIAKAVGEVEVGESMIEHMDLTLAELEATKPAKRITVVGWDGAGNVPTGDTLFGAILAAAGGENIAAKMTRNVVYGRYTAFDLEQLVALHPDLLAYGNSRVDEIDLSTEQLRHRVVRKLYANRQITYPETLYGCGLPQSADAARDLRGAMLRAMARAGAAP